MSKYDQAVAEFHRIASPKPPVWWIKSVEGSPGHWYVGKGKRKDENQEMIVTGRRLAAKVKDLLNAVAVLYDTPNSEVRDEDHD